MAKIKIMKIFKFFLLVLIFLFPLFWLPFTFEFFEFNKLYLLFFGSFFLLLFWLLRQILKEKEIKLCYSKFDFLIFAFILISLLSFFLSKDKISGIFGTYGRFNDGILALLSFFALYLLLRNSLRFGEIKISEIFTTLFISSFLVLIWTTLSLIGVLAEAFVFSPASSSISTLSVFFSLMFIWTLTKVLIGKESLIKEIFYIIFLILSFFLILIFDFKPAFYLLALGLIFFVLLSLRDRIFRENVEKLIFPILFLFLAIIFSFLNFRALIFNLSGKILFPNILPETVLLQRDSWEIVLRSATSSIKNIFLGSGPGTFLENFTKFRPERMREGNLWQIRFNTAGSYFSEILTSFGFLGATIFFLILLWLLALVVFKKGETRILPLKTFLLTSILLPIFAFQNTILAGIFWLSLAIGANFISTKEKHYPIQNFPEVTLIFETLTAILILLFIGCIFFGIKFYLADYYYQKGFLEPNLDKKIEYFQKSTSSNSYQPYYQMVLSQALISTVEVEVQKENPNQQLIQNRIFLALNAAKKAFQLSPRLNYIENLANIYRDLFNLPLPVSGAEDWAIKNYQEAHNLDPKYPLHLVEIAKILMAKKEFGKARENLEKALELVPNLVQAKIQLALILDQEGKKDEAISELEKLTIENPLNSEAFFYLGTLYYNKEEIDKAIDSFQKAIDLFPNYSNAKYFLALSFEKKGNFERALEELKYIEKINPENAVLKKKIKEIEEKIKESEKAKQEEIKIEGEGGLPEE